MTNNQREAYLKSQLDGYEKENKELLEENERLVEKNDTFFSIIAQMGVVIFLGIVALIVALWVMFNG